MSPLEAAIFQSPVAERNAGLDALRAAMVLLVVFHHTAITYGAIGGWFYREASPDGSLGSKLLILMCTVDQAYFMGLLFLLAGYFTPESLTRRGTRAFIKERLLRLGVPILVFGVLIGPATLALASTAKGAPFLTTLLALWSRGTFIIGPLWFTFALLIFTAVYLAWRSLAGRAPTIPGRARSFPSTATLAAAALLTGAGAFALRLRWPVGTELFSLQLGYFASYVVLFAAGCAGAREQWLSRAPTRQRRLWVAVAAIALAALVVKTVLDAHAGPAQPRTASDSSLGGWSVAATLYAFWEPLVAWGAILGLAHLFGRVFPRLGPTWSALVRRSYTIFIIHPPVVVGTALLWRDTTAPHLVKFAITGTVACLVCFWIAGRLLRVPGFSRVL